MSNVSSKRVEPEISGENEEMDSCVDESFHSEAEESLAGSDYQPSDVSTPNHTVSKKELGSDKPSLILRLKYDPNMNIFEVKKNQTGPSESSAVETPKSRSPVRVTKTICKKYRHHKSIANAERKQARHDQK